MNAIKLFVIGASLGIGSLWSNFAHAQQVEVIAPAEVQVQPVRWRPYYAPYYRPYARPFVYRNYYRPYPAYAYRPYWNSYYYGYNYGPPAYYYYW